MAARKMSTTFVWILLALLILGLGGFGVTNLSGNVRDVGSVGDKEIDIDSYARALQDDIRQIEQQRGGAMSFAEAQQLGIADATLARLVQLRALEHEADRLGISVSDETLAGQLRDIPAFQGPAGGFDRDTYSFALRNAGLSESDFETRLREETARTILQGALVAGSQMPDTYTDALVNYLGERRRFTWARLDQDDLEGPLPDPTAEELRAWYETNIDRFTAPEKKTITYAWLSPDMLAGEVEVTDEALRRQYEARDSEFNRPERRLVERLILPDAAAADAARAALDAGETEFDTLVEDRGLQLVDIDMGDVTRMELGSAGEAVFAAQSGDVVGPVSTDLGPALFRVNGILAAKSTSFEDASLALREELAADGARRLVDQRVDGIEDLLAGGATLEDLASETEMRLATIDWFDGSDEGIAAFDGFDTVAASLESGQYPELSELEGGGVFAARVDGTIPPAPQPFEEVERRVRAGWQLEQTLARLTDKAEAMRGRLAESADFEGLGLDPQVEDGITRGGTVANTSDDFVRRVFDMQEGAVEVLSGFGAVQIVRLDAVLPPDEEAEQTGTLRSAVAQNVDQSLAQDLYRAYANDIRTRAGVRIDQSALNAVHSSLQ